MKTVKLRPAALFLAGILGFAARAGADDGDLARQAYDILKKNCYECHGVSFSIADLNVLERTTLVADRNGKTRFVEPGDPKKSLVWTAITRPEEDLKRMPLGGELSEADKQTLKRWIEADAPFPQAAPEKRTFVTEVETLQAIRDHLGGFQEDERKFKRYLTLTHLHNNLRVTETELRLYRAALSKAVNSMSRGGQVAVPEQVDEHGTIYAIDLRDYGWEFDDWREVVKEYPYGFKLQDPKPLQLFNDIRNFSGLNTFDNVAYIRADWFVVKATRPPLYHVLLNIPETLDELVEDEKRQRDFERNTLIRGGVLQSRVSAQNRLIDFFPAGRDNPEAWISYDFKPNTARSNIYRFPLGPDQFAGQNFQQFAFRPAGGEIIFRLPNGMHGYMLVDGEGNRINDGPVDVVRDVNEVSGSPLIVNGLSCMGCHKHGLIDFDDTLATGHSLLAAAARQKLGRVVRPDDLNRQLRIGREEYLLKLKQATAQFLQQGDDAGKAFEEFPEPVSAVARLYERDLDLNDVATELGVARGRDQQFEEELLKLKFRLKDPDLVQFGLKGLVDGGRIKRTAWETQEDDGVSILQQAAREILQAVTIKTIEAESIDAESEDASG